MYLTYGLTTTFAILDRSMFVPIDVFGRESCLSGFVSPDSRVFLVFRSLSGQSHCGPQVSQNVLHSNIRQVLAVDYLGTSAALGATRTC